MVSSGCVVVDGGERETETKETETNPIGELGSIGGFGSMSRLRSRAHASEIGATW